MTTDATLIRAGYVLTAANPPVIADGAVVVRGDRIEAVGRYADLAPRWSGAVTVEDPNGMLVPGFVNTHGHFSEALTTGLGDRLSLWEWIAAVVRPVGPHLTREMARVGTILRGAEMMLSGITTVNDMFVCMPGGGEVSTGVVEGLEALGLRGNVSFGAQDLFGDWDDRAVLAEHRGLAEAAQDSPLVQFRVGVTSIVALSDRLIDSSAELGAELGKPLHAHFHEVREEVTEARLRFGARPSRWPPTGGLLDEGAVAAHCVWLSEVDIEVLVDRRVGVAHNPVANMILGSGVCPLGRLSRAGIAVGLGVDGPASNDGQNMIETLKTAALLQKVHHLDPRVIDAPTALGLATIGGACPRHGRCDREHRGRKTGRSRAPQRGGDIDDRDSRPAADARLLPLRRGGSATCGSPGDAWSRAARFPASTWRLFALGRDGWRGSWRRSRVCPPAWQVRGEPGRQRHTLELASGESAVRGQRPAPRDGDGTQVARPGDAD